MQTFFLFLSFALICDGQFLAEHLVSQRGILIHVLVY